MAHEKIVRETASTGQQKRYCTQCGAWIADQDKTRSKYCEAHRTVSEKRPG